MFGTLSNIETKNTVSDIVYVINHNNELITQSFDKFFDWNHEYLKADLVADEVTSHWGRFKNLVVEDTVTIKNKNAFTNFAQVIDDINTVKGTHQNLPYRFSWDTSTFENQVNRIDKSTSQSSYIDLFAHDASMIIIPNFKNYKKPVTLYHILSDMYDNVDSIYSNFTIKNQDATISHEEDNVIDENTNIETVEKQRDEAINIYGTARMNPTVSDMDYVEAYNSPVLYYSYKDVHIHPNADFNEILGLYHTYAIDGYFYGMNPFDIESDVHDYMQYNKNFKYVINKNGFVKIDNSDIFSIKTENVGDIVTVLFGIGKNTQYSYQIILDNETKLMINPRNIKIASLKLICVSKDEYNRPQWSVYQSSGNFTTTSI